jgi:hypothetical protein
MRPVWNITHNVLDNAPRNTWNVRIEDRPNDESLPFRFRLLDDDENVYLCGRATCEHAALDALDHYEGMGVTLVQYWDDAAKDWLPLN